MQSTIKIWTKKKTIKLSYVKVVGEPYSLPTIKIWTRRKTINLGYVKVVGDPYSPVNFRLSSYFDTTEILDLSAGLL